MAHSDEGNRTLSRKCKALLDVLEKQFVGKEHDWLLQRGFEMLSAKAGRAVVEAIEATDRSHAQKWERLRELAKMHKVAFTRSHLNKLNWKRLKTSKKGQAEPKAKAGPAKLKKKPTEDNSAVDIDQDLLLVEGDWSHACRRRL